MIKTIEIVYEEIRETNGINQKVQKCIKETNLIYDKDDILNHFVRRIWKYEIHFSPVRLTAKKKIKFKKEQLKILITRSDNQGTCEQVFLNIC